MIFDASSLLNLNNGGLLARLKADLQIDVVFGPQVYAECGSMRDALDVLVASGLAHIADDRSISGRQFIALIEKYGLGSGETECLVLAHHLGLPICCDDRRARKMMMAEIGANFVDGTIGLLVKLVEYECLSMEAASEAHAKMVSAGGFLPKFSEIGFSTGENSISVAGN